MNNGIDHKAFHALILQLVQQCAKAHHRPIDYLEVGVQEGHNLLWMLRCPKVRLAVGVDTWGNEYGGTGRGSPEHVTQLLGLHGMTRTLLITGDSHVVLRGLRHPFDFIFVDGDHSAAGAMADLEDTFPLLAHGGVLAFDDVDHPKHSYLRQVAEAFRAKHGLRIIFHHVGYGVAEFRTQK